jgi:hypothetical protein
MTGSKQAEKHVGIRQSSEVRLLKPIGRAIGFNIPKPMDIGSQKVEVTVCDRKYEVVGIVE